MSQYDKSYQSLSGSGSGNSTYNTWNTVPVTITVDTYGLANGDAKNKLSVNFDGDGANGLGYGVLRDVVSIELVQAVIPVPDGSLTDRYVIVNVNGYSRVKSNNQFAKNSFCTISNKDIINNLFILNRTGSTPDDNYIYYFPEPARISKLDIEIASPVVGPVGTNWDGDAAHSTFTFEIRTLNRTPKPEARFQQGVKGPW
jgi:hypothetical protein